MKMRVLPCLLLSLCLTSPASADLFLVTTSEGPGFTNPDEVVTVLENGIIPTFDRLMELKAQGKIVVAGLPAGSRTFYMIVNAESHDEVDRMLRDLPAWGVFSWKVTPLQTLEGRAEMERAILRSLKSNN